MFALTNARGLLISWATPAARVPTEASRLATSSWACIARRSPMSRWTAMVAMWRPSASRSGTTVTSQKVSEPSFRRATTSRLQRP